MIKGATGGQVQELWMKTTPNGWIHDETMKSPNGKKTHLISTKQFNVE